jgi:hypothetical protein
MHGLYAAALSVIGEPDCDRPLATIDTLPRSKMFREKPDCVQGNI